jgi:hypothetical protein
MTQAMAQPTDGLKVIGRGHSRKCFLPPPPETNAVRILAVCVSGPSTAHSLHAELIKEVLLSCVESATTSEKDYYQSTLRFICVLTLFSVCA